MRYFFFFCLLPTLPSLLLVNNLQPSGITYVYILKRSRSYPKPSKEVNNETGTLHLHPVSFYQSWWRKAKLSVSKAPFTVVQHYSRSRRRGEEAFACSRRAHIVFGCECYGNCCCNTEHAAQDNKKRSGVRV